MLSSYKVRITLENMIKETDLNLAEPKSGA